MSIGKLVVVVRTDIRTHKPAVCRFAPRVEIRVGGDLVDTHGPGEIFGEMALTTINWPSGAASTVALK